MIVSRPQEVPLAEPTGPAGPATALLRMALVALALFLVARVVWTVDWARTGVLLKQVGPWLVLGLVPFGIGMGLDTAAWRAVLRRIGSAVAFLPLLRVRLASEAVLLSAPGGAVASEAVKATLLIRGGRARGVDALASVALKKILYVLAHGLYLGIGFGCGREAIRRFAGALQAPWGVAAYGVVTVGMLFLGSVLALSCMWGGPAALALRVLGRLPFPRLRHRLQARAADAHALDAATRSFLSGGSRAVGPVLILLLMQWLSEAGETYLMLLLLGVEVSPAAVIAYDAFNSFVRSIAFFLPAGLGVQELGQVLFVQALGVPEAGAVAAALMLFKRAKDLFWIVTGYGLFGRAWRTA